jgi:hypothetical protein
MLYHRPSVRRVYSLLSLTCLVVGVALGLGLVAPAWAEVIQHPVIQVTTGLDNPNGTTVDTAVPKGTRNVTSSISSDVVGGAVFDNAKSTLTIVGNKLGHATVTLRWTDDKGHTHEQDFSVSVVKGRND